MPGHDRVGAKVVSVIEQFRAVRVDLCDELTRMPDVSEVVGASFCTQSNHVLLFSMPNPNIQCLNIHMSHQVLFLHR